MIFRRLYSASIACALCVLLAAPAWASDPPPTTTSGHAQPPSRHTQPRWPNMTPKQRANVREGVRKFQRMKPQQRRRVREAFHDYQALPPAQKRALREQWRQQHDRRKPVPRNRQPIPAADDDEDPRR